MSQSTVMLFLKMPATAFGVTAPLFIWCAAVGIFVGTLACLLRLWWVVRREGQIYQEAHTQLAMLRAGGAAVQREGMTSRAC